MNNPCEIMKDKITDYILGILDEEEIITLEEHLVECPKCKELLENMQKERDVLLELGEEIDSKMNAREESVIAALGKVSNKQSLKSTFFNSRVFRFAAAAVIVIALLIPLSYGANNIIKRLFPGSVQYDDYKGDFALDKDIRVGLKIGDKQKQDMVSAGNIRFFIENGELRGTLRCSGRNFPKYKWITMIQLLDSNNEKLVNTEYIRRNAGVESLIPQFDWFEESIHFTLGKWEDISNAEMFIVGIKEVSGNKEVTPDAWYESSVLPIVRGRVTDHNGEPVAGTKVQIREKRKPGQIGIAAPDVITDENGFYSYDEINWEYKVSVIIYEPLFDGQGFRHYFKGLNQTFEGSQTIDFEIEEFPTGDAVVFGTMETPKGEPVTELSVDLRSHVDWNNRTGQYTYQYGYKKPFITDDGSFEIENLPAGIYDVILYPTKEEIMKEEDVVNRKEYSFELQDGQRLEIGSVNEGEKLYYGRVLFEDGAPAVPELSEYKTQLIYCRQDDQSGETIATVDDNGYLDVVISNEKMERLESGEASLNLCVSRVSAFHSVRDGGLYPFDLLSSNRDSAGTMTIKRPAIYYGRILYGNGKPAVPEVIPWEGSTVHVILRYTPATSYSGGITRNLCYVDNDGYFKTYLNEEQVEQLQAGQYSIEIYHPSYELNRASYPIASYPFDKLSKEKENLDGYKIIYDQIKTVEFKDIGYYLDSIEKLKGFYIAFETYANLNSRTYPEMIGLTDMPTEDLQWLVQNVEYFPVTKSQDISKSAETVIAYDKTLLGKYDATLVLFRDGHIKYCWSRELEILGIKKAEVEQLP